MPTLAVAITRLSPDAQIPAYQSAGASAMDLHAAGPSVEIAPGEFQTIPCGIAIALPHGFEGQVRPRSGLASRHGVTVLNAPGTIDSDYRGEVKVVLINHGALPFQVTPGMRIAQLVVAPVSAVAWEAVEALPATGRGTGGFGHTGV